MASPQFPFGIGGQGLGQGQFGVGVQDNASVPATGSTPFTESLVEAAFEERVTRQVKAISDQVVGPADRSLHVVYWPFSEYEGEKGELPIGQFCTNPIPSRKCEREA